MLRVRDLLAGQRVHRAPGAPEAPEVSVVLPTWRRNAGGVLGRALESVLSQSFADFELIVVDDGSADGSRETVLAAQAADPRLVHVRHELNCGLPALRVNEGIELARGRWIAFQFDDDEWMEGALEALVERARLADGNAVVFGESLLEGPGWPARTLPPPDVEVHLLTLSFENRIANNSVLVPRAVFDRHGMYDPHAAMRRICDWDLWLRLARHVPFLKVDRRVSRVTVASDGSALGTTIPFELPLFRFLQSIPRDRLLTPARWRDYPVDASRIAGVEVPGALRERLERDHVAPWQNQVRHAFPHLAPSPAVEARPPLLFTMDSFYGSFEMCMGKYDLTSYHREGVKMYYQPLLQMESGWERDAGLILFVRTTIPPGTRVMREAVEAGIPVGYYLDDDLLHLWEYGPPFDLLAPGRERRPDLEAQLAGADAVWVTNPSIAESVAPHNPRILPHNGAVPESWLPSELLPRGSTGRIRVGYAGDPYRIEEFRRIWSALQRISEEFGDRIEFEFWGLDAAALPPLASPVSQRLYTFSYANFIDRLREARFDVLLTPLLEAPRPRRAKAPSQYYHTAVAGALGIFSDVAPYAPLLDRLTCFKVPNDPEAWYGALRAALTLPEEEFDRMRRRMVEHVRLEFTDRAQIHLHEAAVRATVFHAATRGRRGEDGRPRVLHTVPGGEALAREYGVDALEEPDGTQALTFAGPPPAWVPREAFELGLRRVLAETGGTEIVVFGDDAADPGCSARYRRLLHRLGLAGRVRVLRPVGTAQERLAQVGLLLDLGGAGIREAMAAGVLVISGSPAGRALLRDGVTGLLFEDGGLAAALERALALPAERRREIVAAAWRLARGEFHPQRAASELFAAYNEALAQTPAPVETTASVPVAKPLTGRERLREQTQRLGVYRGLSRLYWARKRKRVLVTYDHYTASVHLYWEQALPRLEAATGRSWRLLPAGQVKPEDLYTYHAVVSVRGTSRHSLEILRAAKKLGRRTVYDLDDNLLLLDQAFSDPENPWRKLFGAARGEIEAMLRLADAVKVYSGSAVPSFLPYNPRVTAIRPYQILDHEAPPPQEEGGPVTVGFLGSYYKDDEFGPVSRAILRLLDEGRPLAFEFLGFLPVALARRPEVSHVPWRSSYPEYRRTLEALSWDVGLAPLRDLEFNRGKNNARYREYAAAGIAGIYSDAEVYRATVEPRRTGLVVPQEDEQAWYEAILELAADAELRRTIRENAFADVKANYRIEDYVARVAELLEPPGGRG
jgi:glycosyltransferase involved in cell wall biosynthesis